MNNLQTADMPTISQCYYGNATATNPWTVTGGGTVAVAAPWPQSAQVLSIEDQMDTLREVKRRIARREPDEPPTIERTEVMATQQRRIVQVFIADTNENVPMDSAILFKGEPKFTDLTDQELYFELPIKELLEKHNAGRVKMTDKDASRKSGKDIFLEPIKVRDLKMVVVNIATF